MLSSQARAFALLLLLAWIPRFVRSQDLHVAPRNVRAARRDGSGDECCTTVTINMPPPPRIKPNRFGGTMTKMPPVPSLKPSDPVVAVAAAAAAADDLSPGMAYAQKQTHRETPAPKATADFTPYIGYLNKRPPNNRRPTIGPRHLIKIFIVSFKGDTVPLEVDSHELVGTLKRKISKHERLSAHDATLVFEGKELADPYASLAKYHVKDGSTIELLDRPHGFEEVTAP